MKKLKLVGIKKGLFGRRIEKVVADVYVKDSKVVVESKDKKASHEMQKELNRALAYKGGFYIRKERETKDKDGEVIERVTYGVFKKPDDSEFLKALNYYYRIPKEFGAYTIYFGMSKIVEE